MGSTLLGLMRSGLFNGLDDAFLLGLEPRVERVVVGPGEFVVREGDAADSFYVVLAGEVGVQATADNGDVVPLGEFGPGGTFGEQALLGGRGGRRSADVLGRAERSELARLGADLLADMMAGDPTLGERLRAMGRRYEDNQLARRSDLVRGLLAAPGVEPRTLELAGGEPLFRQGDAAEGFFVVLVGHVELLREDEGLPVRLARLGPGLCVGERDGDRRAVTARADGATRLLAFGPEALEGVRASSPELEAHLRTLEQAWELPQHGFVTQHLGTEQGRPCLTQIYSLRAGRTLVATHEIGGETVRLNVPDAQPVRRVESGESDLVVHVDAAGGLCSVVSRRRGPELEWLFGRAIEGLPLRSDEERAFRDTGRFEVVEDDYLCTCLRVRRSTVRAAVQEGVKDLATLQQRSGAGLSCGSCLPNLREALGERAWRSVVVSAITSPTARTRRITLEAADGSALPDPLPGQHVVLRVQDQGQALQRPYTLSGAAGGAWQTTVQREPEGRFGRWLFEDAAVGAALEASDPAGDFVWRGGPAPVLFFAAGIGITPALCFARTLAQRGWPHALVIRWSVRDPGDAVLWADLSALTLPNLDLGLRVTPREGRLQPAEVAALVRRFPSAECFVCGPTPFQDAVAGWLRDAGVPSDRLHTEDFDPEGMPGSQAP